MLPSQKLAIAAHLHVLLRRKTGRVTDTEWMAANLEYALEIVRFSRAKALEDGHGDLTEWADKLERAVLEAAPAQKPLAHAAMQLLKERSAPTATPPVAAPRSGSDFGLSVFGDTGFSDSAPESPKEGKPQEPDAPRYVGGIR